MLLRLSLAPVPKQQFNKLINGKSQTNRDQKSDLLFLQRHNQYWRTWFTLAKDKQKVVQRYLIFTILDTSQLKILVIVKVFTVLIFCIW